MILLTSALWVLGKSEKSYNNETIANMKCGELWPLIRRGYLELIQPSSSKCCVVRDGSLGRTQPRETVHVSLK